MSWRFGKYISVSLLAHGVVMAWWGSGEQKMIPGGVGAPIEVVGVPRPGTSVPKQVQPNGRASPKRRGSVAPRTGESLDDVESPSEHASSDVAEDWGPVMDAYGSGFLAGKYTHPEYPRAARARGEEGSVLVGVKVVSGNVEQTQVVTSSGHELLDKAAVEAISRWEFRANLALTFTQRVTFRMR